MTNRSGLNVAIRTVLVDRQSQKAVYGTGGGVTYDSTPVGEYREALLKVAVLGRRSSAFQLLETIRFTPQDGYSLLQRHMQRLVDSAAYFDIPLDLAEAKAALRAAVAGAPRPRRVRLLVERSGTIRVETSGLPSPEPLTLAFDSFPVDPAEAFLYHKTTNRQLYDEARKRHAYATDVILINIRGEVTETTIANLAVEMEGWWFTPPIESGLLPGTYRAELLEDGKLAERRLTPSDVENAAGIARLNALRGWEPAVLA